VTTQNNSDENPSVGVIGAGVMGSGIAQTLASSGYTTRCFDIAAEALTAGREAVESGRYGLQRAVELGKTTKADAEAALSRLEFTGDLEHACASDVIIECVPEKLDLKIRTFRELDRIAPATAILASNTSGFSIAAIGAATDRPERVIGWHWASPPVISKFAEIVRSPETSETTINTVAEMATRCGKNPVVVNDNAMTWGFVANRVYGAMIREAAKCASEGVATHAEIDELMVDCFRWPVGPFGMAKGATTGWKKSS
jgi:3-hydroxybutyryl-CoA dehydrogenase